CACARWDNAGVSLEDMLAQRGTALTVKEVAEVLNVSERLIYQQVQIGEIPHFRIGAAVRFEPAALGKWLHGKLDGAGRTEEQACAMTGRLYKGGIGGGGGDKGGGGHRGVYRRDMTEWWNEVLLPKAE